MEGNMRIYFIRPEVNKTELTTIEFINTIEKLDETVNEMYLMMVKRFPDCQKCGQCSELEIDFSEDMLIQFRDLGLCVYEIQKSIESKEIIYVDEQ